MVFTIIVNLYAKDGVEDQLRAKLAEAAQTYSKDAGVLGWYPMQNVSDSRKWTIVERYDQESTVAKHREHPDYKTFAGALLPLLENGQESLDEVLARTGSRNLESSTRSRSERSSPQSTPQPAASDESSTAAPEPITVYPDVSTISIDTKESPRDNKDASRVEGSVRRPREELRRHSSLSSVAAEAETDSTQRDRSKPRHQMGHHQPSPDRRSSFEEVASSPVTSRPFLVHEASAYSYPCRNLIAALRDESISTSVFQQRATRLVRLLIEEALTCLPHEHVQIKNQFGDVCHATKSLDERGICGVSMEDKGMVLLRAFSTISPTSPTGVVSIHARTSDDKNRDDGMWASIHAQLPPVSSRQAVLLLDIQCATGNDACAVLHHLVHEMQISAKSIYFVTVISSFEGLQTVFRHFPDVTLIVAQVDTVLDADQRIRPGIGDFMQRFWNDGVEEQLRAKLTEAAQINSKDAGVLGWHPMQSASDSRKWTIVERYDQESTAAKRRDNADLKAFAESLFVLLENGKESLDPHQFNEL
ncbi:Phosphoribosyltransferase-like [Phytophthora cactorum]|nr:Phosphoribosyltransferase-like [Phytophthora cactorum]